MATMVLADFGADVLRVEPREPGPLDETIRPLLHRGKHSVAADVLTPEGSAVVRRLAATADVVVESLGAGVADRLGVGHTALAAQSPSLVYCSITGYGSRGPLAEARFDDAARIDELRATGVVTWPDTIVERTTLL
jgi:alpha-methylacyl-CoA racemase